MTATPAIEVEGLVKEYGDLRALDGLDLRVEDGEFFGLLGPNGAGKTTFIEILVGLTRKTDGRAEVFGHDVVDDYRDARDAIGLAPQEYNVDRFFPIREVLEHKAGYHGIPPEEAGERADEALKRVGIYDKRDERFDWLSGGMKRRLLLARALVTDPDLLILDEPTAGVDVQLRRDLWRVVRELNESGTTVLLTTHYIEEAERLCDRVAVMDEGKKLDVATPEDLMSRGTDTITVTLADAPAEVPTFDTDAVLDTSIEGDRLTVRVEDGGRAVADVVSNLQATGHTVVDLDVSRTSLEEIFVQMTGEDASTTRGDADESGDSSSAEDAEVTRA
ncbi:ABC transporter ATP-binding protein [Halorubellus sp. JP-L1]|uniref:ABC transporter ATP-binding protein n=1 Tax=Halorubellus sp. JP-L1 TaxID=2715753 RepID=UPI001407CF44|nr:ABC transporter ATP-binding protein [Halorubellus sp. JP-L1]NHN41532.1 ABC transporter ATP-binding protein [Halorubellus sp. JP-L1]